jgi:hypothetical protein
MMMAFTKLSPFFCLRTGCNAFHYAVNEGKISSIRFALAKVGKSIVQERDMLGWTPLLTIEIMYSNKMTIASYLLNFHNLLHNKFSDCGKGSFSCRDAIERRS